MGIKVQQYNRNIATEERLKKTGMTRSALVERNSHRAARCRTPLVDGEMFRYY